MFMFKTQGIPNSLETIAGWDNKPPTLVIIPFDFIIISIISGYVEIQTKIKSSSGIFKSSLFSSYTNALATIFPGLAGVPLISLIGIHNSPNLNHHLLKLDQI